MSQLPPSLFRITVASEPSMDHLSLSDAPSVWKSNSKCQITPPVPTAAKWFLCWRPGGPAARYCTPPRTLSSSTSSETFVTLRSPVKCNNQELTRMVVSMGSGGTREQRQEAEWSTVRMAWLSHEASWFWIQFWVTWPEAFFLKQKNSLIREQNSLCLWALMSNPATKNKDMDVQKCDTSNGNERARSFPLC